MIAGSVHSVQDILDRILLVNSLLDVCNEVYLGGQFGLAALHALGVRVGSLDNGVHETFDQTIEFFKTLFYKSVERKAKLHFPIDAVISSH